MFYLISCLVNDVYRKVETAKRITGYSKVFQKRWFRGNAQTSKKKQATDSRVFIFQHLQRS